MNGDFTLSQSGQVADEFSNALAFLRANGEGRPASIAARWMLEELVRTPLEFGESRFHLPHLDLFVRIAYSGPWVILYSVNVPSHRVFIRHWGLRRRQSN